MDILWAYLKELKTPDGAFTFKRLARVAHLVLTLPHSILMQRKKEYSIW